MDEKKGFSCRTRTFSRRAAIAMAVFLMASGGSGVIQGAENIDPAGAGDQYAWGENVGWLNAEPLGNGGSGVEVQDFKLIGWIWGENIGWISLSCENTGSCGSVSYGVKNNGFGTLNGFAWGENVGWVNFDPQFAGVTISAATGDFAGFAWGEKAGWIHFASAVPVAYKVRTGWCATTPGPPGSAFTLAAVRSGADVDLSWSVLPAASWYDVVRGQISTLRATGGDFTASTLECVAEKVVGTAATFTGPQPVPGDAFWFLVRGANCRGHGTYDTGQPSQIGSRDAEIAASADDCP